MSIEENTEKVQSKFKESLETGFERAAEVQEKMSEAFETATKRNMRITEEWTNAVAGTQKDIIELYKKISDDPQAYGKNIEAWMDSMTGMQKRTIDFSKTVYKENADAAAEMKDYFAPFMTSNEKFREGAKQFMNAWTKPFNAAA